jgi:hypothetical protein
MKRTSAASVAVCSFFLVASAHAQSQVEAAAPVSESAAAAAPAAPAAPPTPTAPKNFLGASVAGFAGFLRLNIGSYEVYYERLFRGHHGLRLAFDFIHVHQNAGYVQSHQWTVGGNLGYRYYFGAGGGPFVGGKFAYRRGPGHHIGGDGVHTHLVNEQILGLFQGGYRHVLPRAHLSLVTAAGVGYGQTSVYAVDRQDDQALAIALAARDNLATTAVALDLELSLAYAF